MKKLNLFDRKLCRSCFLRFYRITFVVLLTWGLLTSCGATKPNATQKQKVEMIAHNDSTEYTLIVLDGGYEGYIATKPPANYHSQQYYENWNKQYVVEWNIRHRNPLRYGGFYETAINYDPMADYGLALNYRLYYYFLFIKERYGIVLVNRGR